MAVSDRSSRRASPAPGVLARALPGMQAKPTTTTQPTS
jgi:hypothetical protein